MSLLGTINPNLNPSRSLGARGQGDDDDEHNNNKRPNHNFNGAFARSSQDSNRESEVGDERPTTATSAKSFSKSDVKKWRDERHMSTLSAAETAIEKSSEYGDESSSEDAAEEEVTRLAQQLTRQSTRFSVMTNAENSFLGVNEDSALNPHGPNFKAKNWMKNMLALSSRDPEKYPRREAGISFKGVNVHGYGSPTDYQKDVFNSVLQVGALFRMMTGSGKQKIQILRDFDGLVKSGEMLVVLGRPGRYAGTRPSPCPRCMTLTCATVAAPLSSKPLQAR